MSRSVVRGSQAAANALRREPPSKDPALVERGAGRYAIFCTPCHGATGAGDGRVVGRGYPAPPAFQIARLQQAPASYTVEVITNGKGRMLALADRIAPADRWAIARYVQQLQRATEPRGHEDVP